MANPIQQGLKLDSARVRRFLNTAAMANPIQQGLKPLCGFKFRLEALPQWLIQYNKD